MNRQILTIAAAAIAAQFALPNAASASMWVVSSNSKKISNKCVRKANSLSLALEFAGVQKLDDDFSKLAEAVEASENFKNPEAVIDHAPAGSYFLVMTHNHALDLALCERIMRRTDFAYFGLIGSKTKRARFIHRFETLGLAPEAIARLTCPIGVPGVEGKEPEVIAASVVAQLLVASSRAEAQTPASARSAATSSTFTV